MISEDQFMIGGKFYCGAHDDCLVCLIPKRTRSDSKNTRSHALHFLYNIFFECILFQVEDAIKSELKLVERRTETSFKHVPNLSGSF